MELRKVNDPVSGDFAFSGGFGDMSMYDPNMMYFGSGYQDYGAGTDYGMGYNYMAPPVYDPSL